MHNPTCVNNKYTVQLHLSWRWLRGSPICPEFYKPTSLEITGYRIKYSTVMASRTTNQAWSEMFRRRYTL